MRFVLAGFVACCGVAQAQTYDLRADFSPTDNPNGPWSYFEAERLLPYLADWTTFGGMVQPAFAKAVVGQPGHIPAIFAAVAGESGFDFQTRDVVMHSWDAVSGAGTGVGSVAWTAPYFGHVDISGSVWMARDIGRTVDVTLIVKGQERGTQRLTSGDEWDRGHQRSVADFASGALSDVPVQAGDRVVIRLDTVGAPGDLVGINLAVDYTESPCRADCNHDGRLNVNDFICFQSKWRARDAYGDYDGSGTYTINDFIRFQADFVRSCP